MKKILIGVGVLVVIVAVGVFVLLGSLDDIVKAAVEKIGSDLTQTEVTLNDVNIEETSGKGVLRGFRVTNPAGFSDDDAFKFDEVSVTIDATSILSDPVIIKEIVIIGPEIIYEFGDSGTNLDRLNKNVQSKVESGGGSSSEGRKFIIENLFLRPCETGREHQPPSRWQAGNRGPEHQYVPSIHKSPTISSAC